MKRFLCLICALSVIFCSLGISALATEESVGADKIHTLFEMNGGFIVENPVDTRETTEKPWLLVGKDVFMTDNGGYPAKFHNLHEKSSFYYLMGSNSINFIEDGNKHTLRDSAIEYAVDYADDSEGYVAIALSYNYSYYIEVYVAPDGRGDISIVAGENKMSMLDSSSLIKSDDGTALAAALGGNGEMPSVLAVSLKVSLNENKSPKKIDVYVNGLFAGTTGAGFADSVENLTPDYSRIDTEVTPDDKLGNIIALEFSPMSSGSINSVYIYSIGENTTPVVDTQAYYAEIYGNSSFENVTEETTTSESESQTVEENTDEVVETIPNDIILDVVLIMACIVVAVSIILIVILIIRKKHI